MTTPAILIATVLVVMLVLALALVAGSLALLAAGTGRGEEDSGTINGILRALDRPWRIERLVYRHHRLFGLLVLAAGIFCLWQLTRTPFEGLWRNQITTSILLWSLLATQALNLAVGLIMLFRPSLLKPVEAFSNRWRRLNSSRNARPPSMRAVAATLALVGLIGLLASATLLLEQLSGGLR